MTDPVADTKAIFESLRRSREERHLTLEEIADATKIGIHQLRVLERGDIDRLPAGIYRRAIIRQYATAVGANPDETIRALVSDPSEVEREPATVSNTTVSGDGSVPVATALWMSAVALCVAGAIAASVAVRWFQRADVTVSSQDESPSPVREDAPDVAPASINEAGADESRNIDLPAGPPVIDSAATQDGFATEGELRITSIPAGAQVTVNGIGWNATPVTVRYLPLGEQLIRVTKSGFTGQQRSIEITADRPVQSIRLRLSPLETP